ncbi:DUF4328 domain-containing protein [Streptomyces sp. NPDC060031]|uniref:DUF4328 domain-containing protein n=1 Tax=Streptomyces sp. NPDC060031 TaxID=3347043 RepID=UPI0036C01B5C
MSFSAPGPPPSPPQQPYATNPYPAQPQRPQAHAGQPGAWQPPVTVGVLRSPRGLSVALTVLLAVSAVLALCSAGAYLYIRSLMADLLADPAQVTAEALDRADILAATPDGFGVLAVLATGIVFIVWFHRVRQNGAIFRPDGFTMAPGWAIGGWFVPLAFCVIPYMVAKQTWYASTQFGPDGSFRKVSVAPVTAWWVLFVVSQGTDRIFTRLYESADGAEELRGAATGCAVSGLISAVAAVLAIVFVRKLTALQTTKAVQGPYAAL